jgi:DNA polymerase-1
MEGGKTPASITLHTLHYGKTTEGKGMNILDLLKEDKFNPKRVGSTHGGEYAGPCPWCGGKDRFRVWPNSGNGGNYWCRKCQKSGGTIRYLMEYRRMSYQNASNLLDHTPSSGKPMEGEISSNGPTNFQPTQTQDAPPAKWQIQAEKLVKWAEECLWDPRYFNIPKELNNRGLKDSAIKNARLGWLPQDSYPDRESWGLSPVVKKDGNPARLRIPAGLIIPYFQDGHIQRLRIRLLYPENDLRYFILPGSISNPMVLYGSTKAAMIVESDLDAILVHQEAGDVLTVISLGSAVIKPDNQIQELLTQAEIILVSLDSDEAGAINSRWWVDHLPNARRWPMPKGYGKDPSEAFQMRLNIKDWVLAGITAPKPIWNQTPVITSADGLPSEPFTLIKNREDLAKHLSAIVSASEIGVRAITTGLDPYTDEITHLFLAPTASPALMIEMGKFKTQEDLAPLAEILRSPSRKIFHDAKPILKFLKRMGISSRMNLFDTMLADQILTAGMDKRDQTLNLLAKEYLREPIIIGNLSALTHDPAFFGYWAYETALLFRLETVLSKKLEEAILNPTAALEFDCIPALAEMELNGMLLDQVKARTEMERLIPIKARLEQSLKKDLGDVNPNNQNELLAILKTRGIGLDNTRQQTLMPLAGQYPLLKSLVEYRKTDYLLTLIENLLSHVHPFTGRIHPTYHQIGAPTGRMSCSNPNLQAIPRERQIRELFIAAPGHRFIVGDYSQIELRVVAEIAQDQRMIEAFQKGVDLHKLTASVITGKPIDQVTPEDRQAAKAVNFGLIYAMGANGLKEYAQNKYGVSMSDSEAHTFVEKFFEAYQGIAQWHKSVQELDPKDSRTILGRRRLWAERPKITELLNAPVQGTAADITKKALFILQESLQATGARVIGCVHDEIILEAPEDVLENAKSILRIGMERAGETHLQKIPVKIEGNISHCWEKEK